MRFEPGHVGVFDAALAHQCRFWEKVYPAALGAAAQAQGSAGGSTGATPAR
jgi:hypothetical protein